jgi:hypothetical protein
MTRFYTHVTTVLLILVAFVYELSDAVETITDQQITDTYTIASVETPDINVYTSMPTSSIPVDIEPAQDLYDDTYNDNEDEIEIEQRSVPMDDGDMDYTGITSGINTRIPTDTLLEQTATANAEAVDAVESMQYPHFKRTLTFTLTVPKTPSDSIESQFGIFKDALIDKFQIDSMSVVIYSISESAMNLEFTHKFQVVAAITLTSLALTYITESLSHGKTDLVLIGVPKIVDVNHVHLSSEQKE